MVKTAQKLNDEIFNLMKHYHVDKLRATNSWFGEYALREERAASYWQEILQEVSVPCFYYEYLAVLTKYLKPKQIIEIGADMGASTNSFLLEMPKNSKLYSFDNRPDAWEGVMADPRLIKIIGDDLNEDVWPNGFDPKATDLWLIDGDHNVEHVGGEVTLFSPYWKKGSVIIFDDLDLVNSIFNELPYDKTQDRKIHGNNVGIVLV